MRRLCYISLCALLAMMLVVLTAGVSFVRCCHLDTAVAMQMYDADRLHSDAHECHRTGCCHAATHNCWSVTTAKLDSYDTARQRAGGLEAPVAQLPQYDAARTVRACAAVAHAAERLLPSPLWSPPRGYLALFSVLII